VQEVEEEREAPVIQALVHLTVVLKGQEEVVVVVVVVLHRSQRTQIPKLVRAELEEEEEEEEEELVILMVVVVVVLEVAGAGAGLEITNFL
jgi:Na+/H+ antiporter NhaD/arsenite permease-like protein